MGGGKGGGSSSQGSMPQWYEDAAEQQAMQAQRVGMLPYMPWMGADVAAAPQQLQSAWNMGNQFADAFGMGGAPMGNSQMPSQGMYQMGAPQQQAPGAIPVPGSNPNFGGGHSSWGGFNENLQMLAQYYPGIMDAYYGASPDAARPIAMGPDGRPVPGAAPSGPAAPAAPQMSAEDEMDRMRWFKMSNESSNGYNPRVGPSDLHYKNEYNRLREKFGDENFRYV